MEYLEKRVFHVLGIPEVYGFQRPLNQYDIHDSYTAVYSSQHNFTASVRVNHSAWMDEHIGHYGIWDCDTKFNNRSLHLVEHVLVGRSPYHEVVGKITVIHGNTLAILRRQDKFAILKVEV